jgi:hypothetical protein
VVGKRPLTSLGLENFQQWLLKHAAAVAQLVVDGTCQSYENTILRNTPYDEQVLQLPAAQLQQLQKLAVTRCQLAFQADACGLQQLQPPEAISTPASSSSGSSSGQQALCSLTSLTSLILIKMGFLGPVGLGGLSTLTGLQELGINFSRLVHGLLQTQKQEKERLVQRISPCLSTLMQLKQLQLREYMLPRTAVAPFSCLQQLQELTVLGDIESPDTLVQLPQSLTQFAITWGGQLELSSRSCPGLAALTILQELDVCAVGDELDEVGGLLPDFCSEMRQLRVLNLYVNLARDALHALTHVLPALSRLESLVVTSTRGELVALPPSGVAGYFALLPLSQHTTRLELSWDHVGALDWARILRRGCGQHLFAAERQLPQLKQLVLGVPPLTWERMGCVEGYAHRVSWVGNCLGDDSLPGLVSCCPGLEQLCIAGLVEPGVDMSPLLQLTALTELYVGGGVVDDNMAGSVLARLSSLQSLGVFVAKKFTDCGLLKLTSLKQLTRLVIAGCKISRKVSRDLAGDNPVYDYIDGEFLELQQQVCCVMYVW